MNVVSLELIQGALGIQEAEAVKIQRTSKLKEISFFLSFFFFLK